MTRQRLLALLSLLAAGGLFFFSRYPDLDVGALLNRLPPKVLVPQDHMAHAEHVKRLLKDHPARRSLGVFYYEMAELLPRVQPLPSGVQFRRWLQTAAELYFGDDFQKVPGLADAIHGPDGVIAKIYGLDAGKLDVPRMQAALRAVAWAASD